MSAHTARASPIKTTYGHFSRDGTEFEITNPATPRPWYNYLWNDRYVALFAQTAQGESLTQDALGRRIEVVSGRMVFVRDQTTGKFWNINGLPVDAQRTGYRCVHGLGYSVIESSQAGIASRFRMFVPQHEVCEIWTINLQNTSPRVRRLSVFLFASTNFDGVPKPQAYFQGICRYERWWNAVVRHKHHSFDGVEEVNAFMTADRQSVGFDGSLNGFVGHGTDQRPDAVVQGHCRGTDTDMLKSCFALEFALTIPAGKEVVLQAIVGAGKTTAAIADLRRKFFRPGRIETELRWVGAGINALLGSNKIETPDSNLNAFFHPWLKRQASLGTQWARVRHNGFRDQMQDIGALALMNPAGAGKQLCRVLAYQYPSGYAPRTWLDGKILDKDFSDNHVWITYAVHQLVLETGNLGILDWKIPFNDGSVASLYEHMKRAVNFYWQDRARFGLLKIRSGDWNDCLQLVGPQGRGVSIWLSMAWYLANQQFAELSRLVGHESDYRQASRRGQQMKRLVNRHGWDGDWYLRAYNDRGEKLGSRQNKEGTLFLMPQTWSVITGIAEGDRGLRGLQAADRYLETELGTTKILHPFSHWNPKVGSASLKAPGTHENGGVYLHACAFKLMADCLLKRHDRVAMALHKMLPFDSTYFQKTCEPYVFSNSYFANQDSNLYGTPGQSWGTGTAGWFYVVMLNHVYGLRPAFDGLRVDPCLPPEWKRCAVIRQFRGAEYRVTFDQSRGYKTVADLRLNGKKIEPTQVLPHQAGQHYEVQVMMH